MPPQDRGWGDDGRDLTQQPTSESLALRGETAALVIGEPEPSTPELLLEDAVLLNQVLDRTLLLAVNPACDGQ